MRIEHYVGVRCKKCDMEITGTLGCRDGSDVFFADEHECSAPPKTTGLARDLHSFANMIDEFPGPWPELEILEYLLDRKDFDTLAEVLGETPHRDGAGYDCIKPVNLTNLSVTMFTDPPPADDEVLDDEPPPDEDGVPTPDLPEVLSL